SALFFEPESSDALGYFHYLIAIVSIAVLFLIPIYLWKVAKTV
ncbi:hypothetical protein J532_4546, partial [Acinetobacter baumannii 940793]